MPNYNETDNIARRISSPGEGGNDYPYGCIPCQLYIVDGGSIDWTYGELGIASISTELSGGDFLPAFSCIDNPGCGSSQGIWPENKGMLTYLAKIARTPYLLSHGPDANAVATDPMTATQGSSVALTATIKFDWRASDNQLNAFSQSVGAAEYYLDTPPWAGGTPVAMVASDGTFDAPTEGAQATIDTTSIPVGRHILFVRGRGQNDFSGYQTWGPISAAFLDVLPSGSPTLTPTPTSTAVPTDTPTLTSTPVPTSTDTPTPTDTPMPPTATSTDTPTDTPVPPTATDTPPTPMATNTPIEATATDTPVPPTATSTICPIQFTDVDPDDTFYANIRCLACRGIIDGYTTGCDTGSPCFKPGNLVTRGQMAKIVSNAAGFHDTITGAQFEDVPEGSTFYDYVGRLATRGYIVGYPCGGPGEPCGPSSLPYFRPNANVTRGQISKIVANAAGFTEPSGDKQFEDVLEGSTFYDYIWRLANRDVMTGYLCGGPGEPCGGSNLPYFRPGANATRGQVAKIVANAFFPACETP